MKDVECQLYLHQGRGIKFHLHTQSVKRVLHHAFVDRVGDVRLEADQQPSQVLLLTRNILIINEYYNIFHLHMESVKSVLHHTLIDRVGDVRLEADQQPSQVLLLDRNILIINEYYIITCGVGQTYP